MKPKNIKKIQMQSRKLRVRQIDRHTLVVESTSNPHANHIVTVRFDVAYIIHTRCTCPWALNHGVACSHVMAALEYLAAKKNRTLSFWTDKSDAERQKHRLFYLSGSGRKTPDSDDHSGVWITSRGVPSPGAA